MPYRVLCSGVASTEFDLGDRDDDLFSAFFGRTHPWFSNRLVPRLVFGGSRNDRLFGDPGTDRLYGEAGSDIVFAGFGSDQAYGGPGDDELHPDTPATARSAG